MFNYDRLFLLKYQIFQLFDSFDVILCSSGLQGGGGEDENCKDQLQHPGLADLQLLRKRFQVNC